MKFKLPKIKEIKEAFEQHHLVLALLDWSKRKSFPGFFNVPIYDVGVFLLLEIKRFALITRANSMAFSFFLSLFPSIIFLFALATHFPIYDTFEYEIDLFIDKIMKNDAGQSIKSTIPKLLDADTGVLSLGFIFAIYFASNGILDMMRSFEKSHIEASFKNRSAFKRRLISVALTFQLGFLLIASVIMIVLGKFLITETINFLDLSQFTEAVMNLFRWLVILILLYSGIAIIYRYGAPTIKKFRFFTPGTTLATILSVLTSVAFSFYTSHYGRYDQIYGPIASTIVLMLWIQINSFILLVGFELNASIAVNRDLKQEIEDD